MWTSSNHVKDVTATLILYSERKIYWFPTNQFNNDVNRCRVAQVTNIHVLCFEISLKSIYNVNKFNLFQLIIKISFSQNNSM